MRRIEAREFLSVALSLEHDIVDGASAACFTQPCKEVVEAGDGLNNGVTI